jgi:hypothetical protein
MRARNIKPGFFKNEELAEIAPPWGRLLFEGLWGLADREGRLADRPGFIAVEIFPYDIAKDRLTITQVDAMLTELSQSAEPFILRYEINGRQFIQILEFTKHQSPHRTEKVSEIPPYQQVKSRKLNGKRTVGSRKSNGKATVSSRKSNGGNRPDSLIHGKLETPPPPPLTRGGAERESDFLKWKNDWPKERSVGWLGAEKVWKRLAKQGKLKPLDEMLAVLAAQKRSEEWQRKGGRFIPRPEKYLESGGFLDESVERSREPPAVVKRLVTPENAHEFARLDCPICGGKGRRLEKVQIRGKDVEGLCQCECTQEARGP